MNPWNCTSRVFIRFRRVVLAGGFQYPGKQLTTTKQSTRVMHLVLCNILSYQCVIQRDAIDNVHLAYKCLCLGQCNCNSFTFVGPERPEFPCFVALNDELCKWRFDTQRRVRKVAIDVGATLTKYLSVIQRTSFAENFCVVFQCFSVSE